MKNLLCRFGILFFFIGIVSCGFAMKETRIPGNQFNKAFDTAIKAGLELGYTPEYRDKENGAIDLIQKVGSNEYRIAVRFYKAPDNDDLLVKVKGRTSEDLINPFIGSETNKILKAIESQISPVSSK